MIKKEKISDQDNIDWKDFIDSSVPISNKDLQKNISTETTNFKFDFHGFTLDQANKKIKTIINKCYDEGISEILIITGKGKHSKNIDDNVYQSKEYNKLKYTIPEFIKNDDNLISKIINIKEAKPNQGGDGAIVIKLKKL